MGRIEAEAAQAAAERDLTGAALDEYVGVVRDEFNGAEDVGRRATTIHTYIKALGELSSFTVASPLTWGVSWLQQKNNPVCSQRFQHCV